MPLHNLKKSILRFLVRAEKFCRQPICKQRRNRHRFTIPLLYRSGLLLVDTRQYRPAPPDGRYFRPPARNSRNPHLRCCNPTVRPLTGRRACCNNGQDTHHLVPWQPSAQAYPVPIYSGHLQEWGY